MIKIKEMDKNRPSILKEDPKNIMGIISDGAYCDEDSIELVNYAFFLEAKIDQLDSVIQNLLRIAKDNIWNLIIK